MPSWKVLKKTLHEHAIITEVSNAQGLCVKGGNWRASRSEVYVLHLILSQNHAYYYRVSCADLLAFAHRITILVYIMYFDQIVSMVIVCVCVCV